MPLLPRPKLPPRPVQKLRDVVREGRHTIEKARDEIRSIAEELRGEILPPEPPSQPHETPEEESCPVCSEMTNLREYIGKRKVKKALSELEKSGDRESVEILRKYVEGEDVV